MKFSKTEKQMIENGRRKSRERLENCNAKINGKCICCGGDKIINKGTSVESPCPICYNEKR
jgi:hypothetical protein